MVAAGQERLGARLLEQPIDHRARRFDGIALPPAASCDTVTDLEFSRGAKRRFEADVADYSILLTMNGDRSCWRRVRSAYMRKRVRDQREAGGAPIGRRFRAYRIGESRLSRPGRRRHFRSHRLEPQTRREEWTFKHVHRRSMRRPRITGNMARLQRMLRQPLLIGR